MEAILFKTLSIVLLVVGFGFVIFWHELGHFLAAKWVGIKVEQFAVGMGHALVSFRKGIGFRWGNTRAEYDRRVKAHLDAKSVGAAPPEEYTDAQITRAADELGLGETEYRISWIPVGGYVKMLGQDDTKANSDVEDPRAYNKKSIPQRMLVVSAGVLMNILLAGILFMILFMYGFRAPASVVGTVLANSPAQEAGFRPGDTIVSFNGTPMHDFTKVKLNTALAATDQPTLVKVRRVDRTYADLKVRPVKPEGTSKAFLAMGITPAYSLTGPKEADWAPSANPDAEYPELRMIRPGDVITKIDGRDVRPSTIFTPEDPGDFHVLVEAAQNSHGKPVELTIRRKDGTTEVVPVQPHFQSPFGGDDFAIAGMLPRVRVVSVLPKSPAADKLKPGDVIKSVEVRNNSSAASQPGDIAADVSLPGYARTISDAGAKDRTLNLVVLRGGKPVEANDLRATVSLGKDKDNVERKDVGAVVGFEEQAPVIAAVANDSPAAKVDGGLPAGARITAVDGHPVANWFDVHDALANKPGTHKLTLEASGGDADAKPIERTLTLGDADAARVGHIQIALNHMFLAEEIVVRHTGNPITAMGWGVAETRDLILQFYVTLQRMFGGSISPTNLMGPVGIFGAGAQFAFRGTDWLLWFLAMISANLAVVNFLPIPIVDGGLFLFLIIEKIQGRPLSRRAQEIAQYAGLVLILSVFVMVTYNDIARLFN